ncbi:PST family polysaccharide transporter [Thioclava sp. ES.031]|uniref:O-antigen translocase n=1 Tax=Thioclava sp. ES.031 TaxID=1798203 RepID=UPI000BF639F7|nr:O-antigen translocase [Thioclava sp. ES.031]PFG62079.1 PST family polysaccharide transporter [Thioclava sp. ES.031]
MSSTNSYRTILRSSSIIAGAQVVNILVGLIRMKIIAVLIGPAGVGLLGLYANLLQTATMIAGLGLDNVGTRQIATAHAEGSVNAAGRRRRIMFWGAALLAALGALIFWLSSGLIAQVVLGDSERAHYLAWLSIGVALNVGAVSQSALLTGMRRIGDLGRISILAGVLGTVANLAIVWVWGMHGLIAIVLVTPVATFLLGHIFVSRLGPAKGERPTLKEMAREWGQMARLGFAFMISGLVATIGILMMRTLVQRELGPDALGQFQAAWAIGMTYLGFVLGAMGTDYFPRLATVINDPKTATRLVNEQTEVALLLAAPILLTMLGFLPWLIKLLYTQDFAPAVEVLRWQLLGDILKVMSWPLGFVIIAAGAGKTFVATEAIGMAVLLLAAFVGLPITGITSTGIAFLAMYTVYLPLVYWLAYRLIRFRFNRAVQRQALTLIIAALAVDITGRWNAPLGASLGLVSAIAMGLWALVRLADMTGATGKLGRIASLGRRLRAWMNRRTAE